MVDDEDLINEVVDDLKRFIKDLENNNEIYYALLENGNFEKIYSKDIKVGDIILIKSKQRAPADCILLRNLNKNEEYTFKVEEKKLFGNIKLNKNSNVYNKINKSYYHFNKNIDNELIDDRYNESNNNYSETSNNLLFSENEKSQNGMKEKSYISISSDSDGDNNNNSNTNNCNNNSYDNNNSNGNTNMNTNMNTNVNNDNSGSGSSKRKSSKNNKKKKKKRKKKSSDKSASNETANYTYVKTDKIDGETDWKIKYPIHIFQNFKRLKDFFTIDILFIIEQPKNDIYKIEGSFVIFKYNPYGDFKTVENNNNGLNDNQLLNYSFDLAKDEGVDIEPNEDYADEEEEYDDDDDEFDEDDEDDDDDENGSDEEEEEIDEHCNKNNQKNRDAYDEVNTYAYTEDDDKRKLIDKGYMNLEETEAKDTDYMYNKKEINKEKDIVKFVDVEKGGAGELERLNAAKNNNNNKNNNNS
ncbi:phospholipid-transporting ATPase, putative, partial [Plasmodium malariae]